VSSAQLAIASVLAAIALSACSSSSVQPDTGSRGRVDDPRTHKPDRVACLRAAHLPVSEVGATGLQIGPLPAGPTIIFTPTPGASQHNQVEGKAQGAEVIGSALLYPHQASESELTAIENCLAKAVKG
jgi:hypothetical protein